MHRENGQPLIQLAPMEGVLDWTLRELLSHVGGVDRMVTEFVRVTDKLLPDHVFLRYSPELLQGGKTRAGTPVFVQLLGGEAGPLAENAARVADLGAPGVDLNFGCPAKTVNRHDGGAVLLKHPERLLHILRAVRAAVRPEIPVTAKVRLGFEHKDYHREIAQAAEEGGAAQIVVHARTKMEMYTPPAHWKFIRSMREGRKIPFLANGEIWTVADYWACVEDSGVQDVALGRGLVRNPLLAMEIRRAVAKQKGLPDVELPEFDRYEFLIRFIADTEAMRGAPYAVARVKQLLRYWSAHEPRLLEWFTQIKTLGTLDAIRAILEFHGRSIPTHSSSNLSVALPIASLP